MKTIEEINQFNVKKILAEKKIPEFLVYLIKGITIMFCAVLDRGKDQAFSFGEDAN